MLLLFARSKWIVHAPLRVRVVNINFRRPKIYANSWKTIGLWPSTRQSWFFLVSQHIPSRAECYCDGLPGLFLGAGHSVSLSQIFILTFLFDREWRREYAWHSRADFSKPRNVDQIQPV